VTFEAFDIVVVPFPFTDRRGAKRRPALVVSAARFNRSHHQSILAMITTSRTEWRSDVVIEGWREAGLNVSCKVRFKLFTLDKGRIVRKLGALNPRDRETVGNALSRVVAAV